MRNVCILGTLPPPVGGVSNHILRLIDALNKEGYTFDFVDLRKKGKVCGLLSFITKNISKKYDVIHYQLNNWLECWLIYVLCLRKNTILISTIHSFRPDVMGNVVRGFAHACINTRIRLIAPSEAIKGELIRFGFDENRVIVHHTYLSPTEKELSQNIPEEISSFIDSAKEKNGYVILGNAYKLYLDKNREDVYGLDMCIEMCKRISNVFLVFCMPLYDPDYKDECLRIINENKLSDRILLYTNQSSLVSIFKKADLFVRPTITDSFGISVAEALECGIPALASDVCNRAQGTILYRNKDIDDFCEKIYEIMQKRDYIKPVKIKYIDFYIDQYNGLER